MGKYIEIGIVGHGFVGSAVANGFKESVRTHIVDPKHNDMSITQLSEYSLAAIFLCVPTPPCADGSIDDSILVAVLKKIAQLNKGKKMQPLAIVKSTAPPSTFHRLKEIYPRLVHNPEFLTERNHKEDFLNPFMHVFGGDSKDVEEAEKLYIQYSSCAHCPTYKTDIITAALLKYTLNCFLATKVVFFNQLKELHDTAGAQSTWEEFIKMMASDKRIGTSHMHVPGQDHRFGYSGSCFPKDVRAFVQYATSQGKPFHLLEEVHRLNTIYRKR